MINMGTNEWEGDEGEGVGPEAKFRCLLAPMICEGSGATRHDTTRHGTTVRKSEQHIHSRKRSRFVASSGQAAGSSSNGEWTKEKVAANSNSTGGSQRRAHRQTFAQSNNDNDNFNDK